MEEYFIMTPDDDLLVVRPQGRLYQQLMGEDRAEMSFVLHSKENIPIGSTTEVFGAVYYLFKQAEVTQISTKEWHYNLEFQSVKYHLANISMLFYDSSNVLNEAEFHIHGTADEILDVILLNANRSQSGWNKGNVKATTPKLVHFSKSNCLEAIATIAEVFELEYRVDSDKTIHLETAVVHSGIELAYGFNKGIVNIAEQVVDKELLTRLYAQGSDKNLPTSYGSNRLQLPGLIHYLERNVELYGLREHVEVFEDIYPHRIGTVTGVDTSNIMKFSDSDIDFDLNERDQDGNTTILMPGLSAKIVFQTGQLAGYRFEIAENGYNSTDKSFIILKNLEEKDLELPSENLKPAVGDTYILEDIQMPSSYVVAAEEKLRSAASFFLLEHSALHKEYKVTLDPLYLKRENIIFSLGNRLKVLSDEFDLKGTLRIASISTNLSNAFDCQLTLSDHTYFSLAASIKHNQNSLIQAKDLRNLKKQVNKNATEANEIQSNFDEDGYFLAENIKDESITEDKLSQDVKNKLEKAGNIIDDTEPSEDKTFSSDKLTEFLDDKVDKVIGKGLSENDLTDKLLQELEEAFGWGNHADGGYLKSINLEGYATESWVNDQGFLTFFEDTTYTASNGIEIDINNVIKPKYGTIADTIAQGNDSRFHTHTNKSILDAITSTKISKWDANINQTEGDARYALRARTILGAGYITGGGNLTANRTLDLTAAVKTMIDSSHNKKIINAVFVGDSNRTLVLTREDGTILEASILDAVFSEFPDDVLNTITYNTNNDGVLRAITSFGEIITVSLDGRHSLLGHKHVWADITDRPTKLSQFSNDLGNYGNWITKEQGDGWYEPIFSKNPAFNKDFGTGSDDVARGNHSHKILSAGDGLVGSDYSGATARVWSFDTNWGDTRYGTKDFISNAIADIEIGGRNYLLDSKKTLISAAHNRQYLTLSEPTIIGELYFFTIKCDDIKNKSLWIYDNTTVSTGKTIGRLELIRSNIYGIKFIAEDSFLEIRVRKNDTSDVILTTYEAKLEKGNKASPWTLPIEEMWNKDELTTETIGNIDKGVIAHGWGDFRDFGLGTRAILEIDSSHSKFIRQTNNINKFGGIGVGVNVAYGISNIPGEFRTAQLFLNRINTGSFTAHIGSSFDGVERVRELWHDGNLRSDSENDNRYVSITNTNLGRDTVRRAYTQGRFSSIEDMYNIKNGEILFTHLDMPSDLTPGDGMGTFVTFKGDRDYQNRILWFDHKGDGMYRGNGGSSSITWSKIWMDSDFNISNYLLKNDALTGYVRVNGVQDIADTKTFLASPVVPNPTLNAHAVNKKWVEDRVKFARFRSNVYMPPSITKLKFDEELYGSSIAESNLNEGLTIKEDGYYEVIVNVLYPITNSVGFYINVQHEGVIIGSNSMEVGTTPSSGCSINTGIIYIARNDSITVEIDGIRLLAHTYTDITIKKIK